MNCKFYLDKGRGKRALSGHPWIFATEINGYDGEYTNGDIVEVYTSDNTFIGKGYINDASQITIRIMTRDINEEIDKDFFRRKLKDAWEYRKKVVDTSSCRFIFGEADFMPGMVIDKFEDIYVIQSLALGIDKYKQTIVDILVEEYNARGVYERSDAAVRLKEGMEQTKGFLSGTFDTMITIEENGVKYYVDIENGQKTGFFLDQKENRKAIHKICKDSEVIDVFTHTGSFALNAGIAGAKSVLGIDISQHAVDFCRKNSELNNLQDTVKFECHDAFDILKEFNYQGKEFDVVILDPPAFTKARETIKNAKKGYKKINYRGIKLVRKGGYLVTASCSHFMGPELFKEAIYEAAKDAGRMLRQVEFKTQAPDHPILWTDNEESYYLKFFIFQVI
ncbi:N2,N2-dimethylguanosine tRNA methyltransferase family protein [Clostridium argentinense CDC 2741]|uniref:N2,N2-dimethylguanosine tRNA methyltransferase family protein n=1 Tax=Clostridium argentinense CDC 2741 TaxID=1418104 RepID=A0A0C1U349_9CLOT|nr:class I SAM-dependent rRNA methyltransferase [Clostridium argentinense]ARC83576.1 rRNA large subunit methyltransferase I [Clostridium argentinense]KIE45908.1 N2,N2-dimethylguanosine tRNA methyltransferase family protein [Clostridium argentinense CDC 2741]NFF40540.1 class I SAM-dependent rRNA methyltransferase [Clostridium argentinense]NFP50858.1 class I SAM-dependent rRNA methyltransferase [Clostridium argentinense]NFP74093.1 class I SAM-dependent rRNA methyltransferase [Clostridium argenti